MPEGKRAQVANDMHLGEIDEGLALSILGLGQLANIEDYLKCMGEYMTEQARAYIKSVCT